MAYLLLLALLPRYSADPVLLSLATPSLPAFYDLAQLLPHPCRPLSPLPSTTEYYPAQNST